MAFHLEVCEVEQDLSPSRNGDDPDALPVVGVGVWVVRTGYDACRVPHFTTARYKIKHTCHWKLSVAGVSPSFKSTVVDITGLKIRGCREPKATLNSPVAPSNFCTGVKRCICFYSSPLGSF